MSRWAQHALVDSLVRKGTDEREILAAVEGVRATDAPAPRVLIAEDEPLTRLDIATLLTAAGFDVCAEAADGRHAVELAAQCRPDAILMDASMPRLDGVSAAEQILSRADVPIVMLTAYHYGELVDRALDAGVRGYVVKPFTEHDVVSAVRAVLSG
jgi:response regulator NasT